MMKYLTRPAEPEYEQFAMAGAIKGGKKLIEKLVKKGKAPKTDVEKVRAQKKAFDETEKELAKSGQIPVKDQTDPSLLTTEDLIEFRKTNRAGKGQFTNAEAIIARLENTIRDIKPDDETYEYVTTTFPNFIKELKANPKLAENDNVFNTLMGELPDDQRFIRYDDGTVDFQTKKPSHQFKLREDLDTDRKGPTTSDKKPGMFDDIFDKMYKDFEDTVPGEQPLTKKKRTLNAEGGVIGGGMIEGEDLGSRTGFAAPKILPKEDLIRLLEEGKTKTEIAKFFETGRNTLDKNIDILISEGELDPSYGKNQIKPTSKRAKLINLINEANSNFKTEKFSKLAEKAGYAKDSDRATLKNFPKLNTSKENVTKYFDSLMSDLNKPASEFKNILTKVSDHVGVSYETVRTSLKNHENYKINKRALDYVGIPMAQKTVLNPDITFLDIAERFETEGSMKKVSSSKRMSGGYGSAEQKIMEFADRHVKQGGNQIEFLTPSNVPDSEKKFKYKGKTYDLETLRLKGPKDPNFKEFYEKFYLSKNIGNKKYKHPLTGKQVPLKEIMAEAYTKATGANILPENVFGIDHSKSVAEKPFTNLRVQDYRTNLLGGTVSKFEELQKLGVLKKEDYTPEKVKFYKKQSGYDFIGNDPDLFVKNQLNLANDIFTKGKKLRQPLEIVKEKAPSTILKSVVIPGAESLADFTQSIVDDVAKGKIASPALKTLGLAGVGYGIYDTGVGFKEGVSVPELGTRFFGLDPVYRYAQEQMSLSPEARKIQAEINRNIAAEAEDVAGLGMIDLQPAKEVTEEEKQILETELEKIRQNRETLDQQRAQERAGLLRIIQDKINNPGATVYRSEFSAGGPGDPSRRKFFKIMGGLASLPILGKIAKPASKIAQKVTEVPQYLKEEGMPDFFYKIVEAVKQFGKKEKYKTGILKEDDVYTYRNPKTKEFVTVEEGPEEVRIEFSSDTGNPSTIGVRKGIPDESTKGKTPPDEYFEQSQIRYPDQGGGGYKDIVDEVAGGYDDLPKILEDVIDID